MGEEGREEGAGMPVLRRGISLVMLRNTGGMSNNEE